MKIYINLPYFDDPAMVTLAESMIRKVAARVAPSWLAELRVVDCRVGSIAADVSMDTRYQRATIRLGVEWCAYDQEAKLRAIVHEFCHLHINPACSNIQTIAYNVSGDQLKEFVTVIADKDIETATTGLEAVIYRLLIESDTGMAEPGAT